MLLAFPVMAVSIGLLLLLTSTVALIARAIGATPLIVTVTVAGAEELVKLLAT